jgi:hypothetical protein
MSQLSKKRYGVYHPKGGALNTLCEIEGIDFEYITAIESETLVRVFYHAQNDYNESYATLGKRSTSVGDIITSNDKVYMVKGDGYKRIPSTKELYKKIMDTDEAIIEILSRKTLTQGEIDELIDNCY